MSLIETVNDVQNSFLARRELVCNFAGLGGKLTNLVAIDMVTKEFKLSNKIVIPIRLKTHVGKSMITGTFYVYEDEKLAKKHVNPTIFSRLEKAKAKNEEGKKNSSSAEVKAEKTEEVKAEKTEEVKAEKTE